MPTHSQLVPLLGKALKYGAEAVAVSSFGPGAVSVVPPVVVAPVDQFGRLADLATAESHSLTAKDTN